MQSQIIITINLPQPVSKIAPFLIAMDDPWPGMVMQAHNPTDEFDDQLDDGLSVVRRGDIIEIGDMNGGFIRVPRRQLAAFLATVNDVGEGPIMLNVDGASTIDIPAS